MGEVIAIGPLFPHNPFVPQFIERTNGTLSIGVAGCGQEIKRECAANGRGTLHQRARAGRELQKTTDEHCMHLWREGLRFLKRRWPEGKAIRIWLAACPSSEVGESEPLCTHSSIPCAG